MYYTGIYLMATQAQINYFLNSKSNVGQLDCIELSHPSFDRTYYLVKNHLKGFNATLENGNTVFFEYVPMQVSLGTVKDNLDQTIDITLGDLGEIVAKELRKLRRIKGKLEKPKFVYRTYRSDDFSRPLYGPIKLSVVDFQLMKTGCSFQAKADSLNVVKTGELYDLRRFPMLKGVV